MADKLGRYIIKSEIARGGMASVIRAYDPSFERDVAIKILPQTFLHDPQFRTRFDREAKMIARIEHPAIVPVYDSGEEDGQPYLVMRYMSGGSLIERLDQGPLSLAETYQIISRLAPALDAAHARNIIHRDIKPGNVLFDQYGNAFLSDFGIARLAEESGVTLTGTSIIGTPAFMSPEQIQGDKKLDGRSDIYSLGVLIYQMLSGQAPYNADTPAKVMMMHVLEPVPSILEMKPNLPPGCDAVIAKAMAKDPKDRYATASELASALDTITRRIADTPGSLAAETKLSAGTAASQAETRLPSPKIVIEPTRRREQAEVPVIEKPRSRLLAIGIPVVAVLCMAAVTLGILAYFGGKGSGPFAFLAKATSTATEIALAPSETPKPSASPTLKEPTQAVILTPAGLGVASDTPTPTLTETLPPQAPIIGGADKVAFLDQYDIWVANLDGSDLVRLTEDGTIKSNLQWSPDGNAVNYISGKCAQTVQLDTGRIDIITCFNYVDYLKSFEISPDGQKVAISLDNQLYIVPYDLTGLAEVTTRSQLASMAECEHFAPYTRNFVKFVRWSRDSSTIAQVIFGVASGIGSADIIQVLPVNQCFENPRALDNFPPPRFRMPAYEKAPAILNFGWEGTVLFVLNTLIRNNGFGDMYIYNMDLHKARMEANPINDSCCYRDSIFSPDGNYLFFAFQQYPAESIAAPQFYYIPYSSIGIGATFEPLPITLSNFTSSDAGPQPALRPAK